MSCKVRTGIRAVASTIVARPAAPDLRTATIAKVDVRESWVLLLLLLCVRARTHVSDHGPFLASATVSYSIVMVSSLPVSLPVPLSKADTFMIPLAWIPKGMSNRGTPRDARGMPVTYKLKFSGRAVALGERPLT